jgi:thiamine biosynthesis lipoprotein
MKETRMIMGMPVTIQIFGPIGSQLKTGVAGSIEKVFEYFKYIDEKFSTYKDHSEIMTINRGELDIDNASDDMKTVFRLAEETKIDTNGYFDIVNRYGKFDPSGIVKGWAIFNAAKLIRESGFENYYVEAGGDIQVGGFNDEGKKWAIGIKNPFKHHQNTKVVYLSNAGIATSGTYIRGQHIYNPHDKIEEFTRIVSLTVIGPNIYDADRFATAAFAMGRKGVELFDNPTIRRFGNFEVYMIDNKGIATMTSGFEKYTNA